MTIRVGVGRDADKSGNPEDSGPITRAAGPTDRPGVRPDRPVATETLWDIHELSDYLKIPVNTLYKMTGRKARVRLPHIRIGNALRFRQSAIDEWLELLTVSNKEVLIKMRQKVRQVSHGHDPQTQAP